MRYGARVALSIGTALVVAVLLLVGAILFLTQTRWGREQVRRIAVEQLDAAAEGTVRIGAVEGNLLTRVRLVDVSIVDEQGRPFLEAESIATGFSLWSLLTRRIILRDTRLVRAVVVLDKPPGEEWNFARIFPPPEPPVDPDPRGWGHWIELNELTLEGGRLTVRTAWEPAEDLTPAERQRAIEKALGGETRENIVRVPGGYQNVMDFRQLDAELPLVRIAHPEQESLPIEVARFSGIAQPFEPPAAVVRDLAGSFELARDSLFFRDVRATLPGSEVAGGGVYVLDSGDLLLELVGDPVTLADLRWLYPPLPPEAHGSLNVTVHRRTVVTSLLAEEMDLRVGESAAAGRLGLVVGDTFRVFDTDLRLSDFDTRLLEQLIPALELPRHGRLAGRVALDGAPDALRVDGDLAFADPLTGTSQVQATGGLGMTDAVRFRDLHLRLAPLQMALVHDYVPQLPGRGELRGDLRLSGTTTGPIDLDGDLRLADPRTGASRIVAAGRLLLEDEVRLSDLRLRFEPLQAALLRDFAPELPLAGTVAGRLRLDGKLAGPLRVDGDLALRDPRAGLSRVAAAGVVGIGEEARFDGLELRFDPLQVALLEVLGPELPIGGVIAGRAVIDGGTATALALEADVEHRDAGERSHLVGTGYLPLNGGEAEVDLRLQPLSLVTAGRFAPAAALRGSASGRLRARGDLGDLSLAADLRLPDGGALTAQGWLDLESPRLRYDLLTRMSGVDLASVTGHAPATALTGVVDARGAGFDPATMHADVRAELTGPRIDTLRADTLRLQLAVADGLARVDTAMIRVPFGEVDAGGSFGLVETRTGRLAYRVAIDSLGGLAPHLPAGEAPPDAAAADTAAHRDAPPPVREARLRDTPPADEVAPAELPDTLPALPGTTLAGRVHAAGIVEGSLARFALRGSADLEGVVYDGNAVGSGSATYALSDLGTTDPRIVLDAAFAEVEAGGLVMDSLAARVDYRGQRHGTGRAVLAIHQDDDTDYRAAMDFELALERSEVRIQELALRFDTVHWRSARPGAVSWEAGAIAVETIDLRSETDGRIFLDGRLPVEGEAELEVAVHDLEIAHVVSLLQQEVDASGRLFLEAQVRGTQASPRFEGTLDLRDAVHEGTRIPRTTASFAYADASLTADGRLVHDGVLLAEIDGTLPIDLAIAGRDGPRLREAPLAIEVRADSLPLDAVLTATDLVDQVEGTLAGAFAARGTPQNFALEGDAEIRDGAARVVASGVRYERITAAMRMENSSLVVDSLVAWQDGPIRVTGQLDLSQLTAPAFDLALEARDVWVLRNEHGRLKVDADLTIVGPFDAVVIEGDAHARRGVIYIPDLGANRQMLALDDSEKLERVDTLLLAQYREVLETSPLLQNLRAEITLQIDRDVWVRSNEANVEIYTPAEIGPLTVRMNGGPQNVTLEGTINTDRGEYSFLSRRFVLTRGAATFLPGPEIDPLVQVAAEHEVRMPGRENLQIRVVLGGTIRDLEITLESSAQPPISQTELLSYLAFGRSGSSLLPQEGSGLSGAGTQGGDLVGNVAGLATQRMAAVAVGTLVDEFESEAARSIGLDVLHIAPADLPTELFTGRIQDFLRGTEIEAGRYLGPRLFVAGQARATLIQPGARVEYRTPGGFRWITTWEPRFLASEPTLEVDREPIRTSVFGAFLFRVWRF